MENYNLGKLINKIRIEKNIPQNKLCYGLCSITTLLRIESSIKDIEIVLAKILLERMGVYSEKFIYILDDDDFILYEKSIYLKKYIKENKLKVAIEELKKYEKKIKNHKNIHYQFFYKCNASIQKSLGNINEAKNLFKKSLECTIPNFEKINLGEYYLSNQEIDIMLEYIDIIASDDETVDFKDILFNLYIALNRANIYELSKNRMYPKVCYMCANLLYKKGDYELCQDITKHALEALALTGDLNFRADIIFFNTLSKLKLEPSGNYIDEFLDAYYVADFFGQDMLAIQIENVVREVYKWESIDVVPLLN